MPHEDRNQRAETPAPDPPAPDPPDERVTEGRPGRSVRPHSAGKRQDAEALKTALQNVMRRYRRRCHT